MKLIHKVINPSKVVSYVQLTIEEMNAALIIKNDNDAVIDNLTNVDSSIFLDYFVHNKKSSFISNEREILLDDIIDAIKAREHHNEKERIYTFIKDITTELKSGANYPYNFMLKNIQLAMEKRTSNGVVDESIPELFEMIRVLSFILAKDNAKIMSDYINQSMSLQAVE